MDLNVGVLEAVVAADGELKLFDAAIEIVVAQQDAAFFAAGFRFDFLFEVDEDVHVVLEQLGGQADSIGGQNGAVGPHFERELVVVGDLSETSGFDDVVDAAHRRVNGVDRNEAQAEIGVEVLVGGDVAAATLEAHFHVELAALRERGEIDVLVEDLDVAVGFDHAGGDHAGLVGAQVERLGAFAVELEGNLLEVQDDVGRVFDDAANGLELVQYAFDADGGDGGAFDGAEQRAPQGVADGGAEAALKGLGAELAEGVGERLGIDCQTLRFLKSSPQHMVSLVSRAACTSRCILRRPRKFSFG